MTARTAWLHATWRHAWRERHRLPARLPAPFTDCWQLRPILGALPVRDCIGDDGHESFEVIPLADAHARDWRVIVAVCDGEGMQTDPFHLARNADRPADTALWDHTSAQLLPMLDTRALVDLVAIHPKRRHLPRLLGVAEALGDADGRLARRGMVWIARDLADWAQKVVQMMTVLPLGTPAERADYLRGCESIGAADVAQADAMMAQMQRPAPAMPQVFVAAGERRVA